MPKILFLVAHPVEDASRRYRVQQFLPLLERAGYQCTVSEFTSPRLFRTLQAKRNLLQKASQAAYCAVRRVIRLGALSEFDFILIHREAFPFFMPAFENWVLRRHPRVIFSFDDAIYTEHPDVSRLSHPWLYQVKYGRSIEPVIAKSCHVVAGNTVLAEYARQFNPRVTLIPTVVDCDSYHYKPVNDGTRPIVVGWIGSHSTASYLLNIAPALRKLAETFRNRVEFQFFGCKDLELKLPRSSYFPFRLTSELSDIRSLDIGLMPMPDTPWTRGKCAFKAIQYMATGVPTVASPVGATLDVIQHGYNGLLAESADQWFGQLCQLVDSLELRRRLSLGARRTIEERYSLRTWGPIFVSLMGALHESSLLRKDGVARTKQQIASSASHR